MFIVWIIQHPMALEIYDTLEAFFEKDANFKG